MYVDFKMSGPTENLKKGWNLIRHQAQLVLEEPVPAHLYLGCIHEKRRIPLAGGRSAQAVVYNMESYLESTVRKYCSLVKELNEGKEVKLKTVATPFLPEDHSDAPARVPRSGESAVCCPWCQHSFPESEFKALRSKSKKKKKDLSAEDLIRDLGRLQPIAACFLMKILYAARLGRFALLRATCKLACYTTKWDETCDRRLFRLVCYIHSTLHLRQVGWIGDDLKNVVPHLYADADFAGCERTERSTAGVHLVLQGPNSRFPISGISKRHSAVSNSTPEAELVSGHFGCRHVLLPAQDLWGVLVPGGEKAVFHEDNQAMIRVCETGRNPTMRHLGRTHGISVRWLHETLTREVIQLVYEESHLMAADIYTKAFSDPLRWEHALLLIGVLEDKKVGKQ